jgi:hypothetical protein
LPKVFSSYPLSPQRGERARVRGEKKLLATSIKDGNSRLEALKLARQAIKAKYPQPFFWAVFILHGEG